MEECIIIDPACHGSQCMDKLLYIRSYANISLSLSLSLSSPLSVCVTVCVCCVCVCVHVQLLSSLSQCVYVCVCVCVYKCIHSLSLSAFVCRHNMYVYMYSVNTSIFIPSLTYFD